MTPTAGNGELGKNKPKKNKKTDSLSITFMAKQSPFRRQPGVRVQSELCQLWVSIQLGPCPSQAQCRAHTQLHAKSVPLLTFPMAPSRPQVAPVPPGALSPKKSQDGLSLDVKTDDIDYQLTDYQYYQYQLKPSKYFL